MEDAEGDTCLRLNASWRRLSCGRRSLPLLLSWEPAGGWRWSCRRQRGVLSCCGRHRSRPLRATHGAACQPKVNRRVKVDIKVDNIGDEVRQPCSASTYGCQEGVRPQTRPRKTERAQKLLPVLTVLEVRGYSLQMPLTRGRTLVLTFRTNLAA